MRELIYKLGGRKFLIAILNIGLGVAGLAGLAESDIQTIASVGMIIIPTIAYIITEGKIDANKVLTTIEEIVDVIEGDDNVVS